MIKGADLHVPEGSVYGLIGGSGSGKTTLARCIMRALPYQKGKVELKGKDILNLNLRELRKTVQLVFQDPVASLSPKMRISELLQETLRVNEHTGLGDAEERMINGLSEVGLSPDVLGRYPYELSGGQAQRITLARALLLSPEMLILDEPLSSVDKAVSGMIVELLSRIKKERSLTYLFITHDLALAKDICGHIAVMDGGNIIESGKTEKIFNKPSNDYTKKLLEMMI